MNEEVLQQLFKDTGLEAAGADYNLFKEQLSSNADVQQQVFKDSGLEEAGADYDLFLQQVSGVGMPKQEEEPVNEDKGQTKGIAAVGKSIAGGALSMLSGIIKSVEILGESPISRSVREAATGAVLKALEDSGIPEEVILQEMDKQVRPIAHSDAIKSLDKTAEKLKEDVVFSDKGVTQTFKEDGFWAGLGKTTTTFAESVPQLAAMYFSAPIGLTATGMSVFGGKYDQLAEEGVDANTATINAGLTAVAELGSEAVTAGLLKGVAKAFTKEGAKEVVKRNIKQTLKEYFKGISAEGGSEGLAQLAENTADYLTGVREPEEGQSLEEFLGQGIADSFIVGAFGGGLMTSLETAAGNIKGKLEENTEEGTQKTSTTSVKKDVPRTNKEVVEERVQFMEDVEEDFRNLGVNPEQREKILPEVIARNQIKKQLEIETDEAKIATLESKLAEIDNKIKKVTGVEAVPEKKKEAKERLKKEIFGQPEGEESSVEAPVKDHARRFIKVMEDRIKRLESSEDPDLDEVYTIGSKKTVREKSIEDARRAIEKAREIAGPAPTTEQVAQPTTETQTPAAEPQQGTSFKTQGGVTVNSVEPEAYVEGMQKALAKRGDDAKQVDQLSLEEAKKIKDEGGTLLMAENGEFGGYVKADGYMGGLFKDPNTSEKAVAKQLQDFRIKLGGTHFDAYGVNSETGKGTKLESLYIKNGFVPVSRMKFNPESAPEGYEQGTLNTEPDVVFFKYDPEAAKNAKPGDGNFVDSWDTGINTVKTKRDGSQNTEFFTGKATEHSSNVPYKPVIKVDQSTPVAKAYKKFTAGGKFTGHISKMIAGFQEKQKQVAEAIVKGPFKKFLDLGTSEGGLIKTVSSINPNIRSVGVDPNTQMKANYESTPEVPNTEFRQEAFLGSWTDPDGTVINEFKTDEKFDVVNEDFTFQFINNDRRTQVQAVKEMMTPDGIFVTSEKFHTANQQVNEAKKYDHQRKYFNPDQLTEDKQTIVSGMADDMVNDVEYFNILKENFKYVEEFWNAGNFKGYLASDNKAVLDEFKKNVGDLTTEFTDTESLTRPGATPTTQEELSPVVIEGNKAAELKAEAIKLQDAVNQAIAELGVIDESTQKTLDNNKSLQRLDEAGSDDARAMAKAYKNFLGGKVVIPKAIKARVEAILGTDIKTFLEKSRNLAEEHKVLQKGSNAHMAEGKARRAAERRVQKLAKEAGVSKSAMDNIRSIMGGKAQFRKVPTKRAAKITARLAKIFNKQGKKLTLEEGRQIVQELSDWHSWYDGMERLAEQIFGEYGQDVLALLPIASMANSSAGTVTTAINNAERIYKGEQPKGLGKEYVRNFLKGFGISTDKGSISDKMHSFYLAFLGNPNSIAVDMHVYSIINGVDPTIKQKSPSSPKDFQESKEFVNVIAQELGLEPRAVQAALWAANILRTGKNPDSYEEYFKKHVEERGLLERVKEWREKGYKPFYPTVQEIETQKKEFKSYRDEVEELAEQMNELDSPNLEMNLGQTIYEKGKSVVTSIKNRLGFVKKPNVIKNISELNGIPSMVTISDTLRTGPVKNRWTGNEIGNLKGGIGYTYSEGNTEHAWAYTDYETADGVLKVAKNIYLDNKELFDHLWASGKLPKNQVPVLVIKMGDQAVISNEAIFRVLADNLSEVPAENKARAFQALKEEMNSLYEAAMKGTVKKVQNELRSIVEFFERPDINTYDDVLENAKDLTIGARPHLTSKMTTGDPLKPIPENVSKPTSSSTVVGPLLEGLENFNYEKTHIKHIIDMLYEPFMKDTPKRHVVAVNGIDITAEGPVETDSHPNYPFTLPGSGIALIEETNHVADILPTAYGNVVSKTLKGELSADLAISRGLPAAMNNIIFRNVPINARESAAKELISFLNSAFPQVKFFIGEQAWADIMESDGVKQYVKDGDIVYGLTKDGDIYLNPKFEDFNTPIHETGHIWIDNVQQTNRVLFEKGMELVEGTKELKEAQKELGDTIEARKEAMAVLIGNKGETLATAAKRSKWDNWLKALWLHVKNTFKSLQGLKPDAIANLTLEQFVEGALADILSGQDQGVKPSSYSNGVSFSKETGSNIDTKIRNILQELGDTKAEQQINRDLLKNIFRSVGVELDDARIDQAIKKQPVDQIVPPEVRTEKERILDQLDQNKDLFESAEEMYNAYRLELDQKGITFTDIESIFLGFDPQQTAMEYTEQANEIVESARTAMKQAGLTDAQVEANMTIFGEIAARWAKDNNSTVDQFWTTKIEAFKFVADQNEIPGSDVLKQAEYVKKSIWDKIRTTLGFNTARKYTDPDNTPTPFSEDKDLESTPEGREFLEANRELIRGARVVSEDGKAIIYLTSDANASTPVHEMAHVYEMYMPEADKQKFLDNIGQKVWDTTASEKFARGFEQFLKEGRTSNDPRLNGVFNAFKTWLRRIYEGVIRYQNAPIILNKEMNEVYANMFNSELTNLDKYQQESRKFTKAIEEQESQMKSDTFRRMSDMFGLDLKNTYERGTLASRARQAVNMGYTTRQFAVDETISLLKVVAETGPNSISLDPIKAFGMKFAVAEMQQQAFELQAKLERYQKEGIDNTVLGQEYVKLVEDINNINTVLTLTSSTAAALLGANAHKFKTDWFDVNATIKTIETKKGSPLTDKQKAEFKKLVEDVRAAREQLERFENQEEIRRKQEQIDRVNRGIQALQSNPIFKQIFEDLKNDPRSLSEIRAALDAKLKAYYGKTSFSTDAAFDETPLQEYIAVLIAMDPNITTINELTQEINITHPAVTQQEVIDILDTDLAARRAQKLKRTLKSNKNKIEREANLVGQLRDILSGNLEPQTPLEGVNEKSRQAVILEETIKELKLLAVDETGDYNFFLLDHYLEQINQMYEGLTAGSFGITDIPASIKESMIGLLDEYEKARSRTTDEKIQTFVEKIRSIDSMINHLNTLFEDSKNASTKEERREALANYRGILRRLAAIPETQEHIDNQTYNKLKAEYARKKSILNQKATEATQSRWAIIRREILNTPRNLILSFDYSYINYQMGFYTMRELFSPRAFRQVRYIADAIRSSVSDSFFTRSQANMLEEFGSSYYEAIDRGLIVPTRAFSETGELLPEETLRTKSILERWLPSESSRYAKLNFIRGIRNFNERGYVDYISRMRVGEYIRLTRGVTDPTVKEEIAERINTLTGTTRRLSKDPTTNNRMNKVVDAAADVLIAPRLYISVFKSLFKLTQVPDIVGYLKAEKNSDLRAYHARAIKDNMHILGAQALGFVVMNALAKALSPGDDDDPVELNPMKPGFMKTKVNQTMLTLNPYSSYIRSGFRIGTKVYAELTDNEDVLTSRRMKDNNVLGVVWDEFLKYRMNPLVTSSRNIFYNKDWQNKEIPRDARTQFTDRWLSSVAPISVTGAAKNISKGQYAQMFPELALDMMGFNSFTVDPIRSEEVEKLFKDKKFTYRVNYPDGMSKAEKDLFKQRVDEQFGNEVRNRIVTGNLPNKEKLRSLKESIEKKVKREFK